MAGPARFLLFQKPKDHPALRQKKNPVSRPGVECNMAGVLGFEPRKCQIQSLVPYRLAIPQCAHPALRQKKNPVSRPGVECNMAGVLGFEPRKCQIQSLVPYRLAIPQCAQLKYHMESALSTVCGKESVTDSLSKLSGFRETGRLAEPCKNPARMTGSEIQNGWGTWIRTKEMPDSESGALPLGYTPMRFPIIA